MDARIIENMEPFNEIYFKSCFYNSLFPVINHFRSDINRILTNEIIVYDLENEKDDSSIRIKYIPVLGQEDLINNLGLDVEMKESCDIIDDAGISISEGRPVIIWIDSFYEPIRADTYMKMHNPHTLLLYGFDRNKKVFNIIEHKHRENLSYKKELIGYNDVIEAYGSYKDNFKALGDAISYYSFDGNSYSGVHDSKNDEPEKKKAYFLNSFYEKRTAIFDGLAHLESFLEYYKKTVMDESLLKNNVESLLVSINNIINFKKVESYRFKRIFSESHYLSGMTKEIAECWEFLRIDVAKYLFFSIY
ncbi:MAG TPA: hypothetical protein VF941_16260, partial [Clostridia bacterium]